MKTKNIAMILTLALTAGLCQTAAPSQAATPKLSAKKTHDEGRKNGCT